MTTISRLLGAAALASLAACNRDAIARSDSLQLVLTEQQTLYTQLQAQKDSLTRVVVDADAFIGQMDSAISTVRGLPRSKRTGTEDPLADQLTARKEVMDRVDALVARAKQTAAQLAELQKKQTSAEQANVELQARVQQQASKIEQDAQLVADLGTTIERQRTMIAALEARVDSLNATVKTVSDRHYRAYYVVGTEKELMATGVAVKEGGANLLIARPGRTLVPARVLNADAFTTIDQRQTLEIQVPDSTKRYRLVSRQNLDAAEVTGREGTTFTGNLKITKPEEFWAGSRFLILVQQ
jgi:hypothetical protein